MDKTTFFNLHNFSQSPKCLIVISILSCNGTFLLFKFLSSLTHVKTNDQNTILDLNGTPTNHKIEYFSTKMVVRGLLTRTGNTTKGVVSTTGRMSGTNV